MQVGLVQKLMFLVFLSLLVSAEDTKQLPLFQNKSSISLIGMNKKKGVSEMKQRMQEQEQQLRVAHSLDEFFTSKRRAGEEREI